MALDLSSLVNAIGQLETSLRYHQSDLARQDPELARQFRSAAIQAFEFTYELSWKMLKRHLEAVLPNPAEVDEMSFAGLIRTANEHSLLRSEWSVWREFRQARGTTSHTYDQRKANEVFALVPRFLEEARHLLKTLQAHQGDA